MDYIIKLKDSDISLTEQQITDLNELLSALENDWAEFNKNPMFHVNVLKN